MKSSNADSLSEWCFDQCTDPETGLVSALCVSDCLANDTEIYDVMSAGEDKPGLSNVDLHLPDMDVEWQDLLGDSNSGDEAPGNPFDKSLSPVEVDRSPTESGIGFEVCGVNFGPFMETPAFTDVAPATQACFTVHYGHEDWPSAPCCPPALKEATECSIPTLWDVLDVLFHLPTREYEPIDDSDKTVSATATLDDEALLAAGIQVLMDNLDIVTWAACLVQSWSPEIWGLDLVGGLTDLLTRKDDGGFKFSKSWVESADNGAGMWAKTYDIPFSDGGVGLNIPIAAGTIWSGIRLGWDAGGEDAFCATFQVAAEVLHEMVHIVGDGHDSGVESAAVIFYELDLKGPPDLPGVSHEVGAKAPCWDECRMVATMFLWAMSQRFPCLVPSVLNLHDPEAESLSKCSGMSNAKYFAYSQSTLAQLCGATCW